jgi:methyl-accepting chemotaxis protein
VPAVFNSGFFIKSKMESIEIIDRELAGVEFLSEIRSVDSFLVNPPVDEAAQQNQAKKQLAIFNQAVKHEGHAENFDSVKSAKAVSTGLEMMGRGLENSALGNMDNLVTRIGDQSGLILDPKLDSYYLMDMMLFKSRALSQAARKLEKAYPDVTGPTDPLFLILRHGVAEAARDLQTSLNGAIKGDETGKLSRGNVPDTVNAVIAEANNLTQNASIGADHSRLHKALDRNWKATGKALETSLNSRRMATKTDLYTGLAISGVAVLAVILLAGLLISGLSGGLARISHRLSDLAEGDYFTHVPGIEYTNDIGVIANALQNFIDMSGQLENERARSQDELQSVVAQVKQENEQLLEDALKQQAEASVIERQMVGRLAAELEQQVSGLLAESGVSAQQMRKEAEAMASSVQGVRQEASAAADAANEIRTTVKSVAPRVETVSQQLSQYTQSLGDAKNLATDAVKRVGAASQKIAEFDVATKRAAKMLETITSVAHRTNMLALNASIEAMRVGEAGQGFMVVASEVKALAQSTNDTANEIAQQIAAMEGANQSVNAAFEQVLEVVNTLASRSVDVAGGMEGQAASIAQVDDAIQDAMNELSKLIDRVNHADSSAGSAMERSREMLNVSGNVSAHFTSLDSSVRGFLGNIQNAQSAAA